MASTFLLEYIEKDSIIHRLNGAAKLICFLLWTTAIMLTYDTRLLIFLTVLGFILFKVSKIRFKEIKIVFYLISIFLILNLLMIFLFSPLEGTKIYGTQHDIFKIFGNWQNTINFLCSFIILGVYNLKRSYLQDSHEVECLSDKGSNCGSEQASLKYKKACKIAALSLILNLDPFHMSLTYEK